MAYSYVRPADIDGENPAHVIINGKETLVAKGETVTDEDVGRVLENAEALLTHVYTEPYTEADLQSDLADIRGELDSLDARVQALETPASAG